MAHLARRRLDAAHKATTAIARVFTHVAIEDLRVKNMTASAAGTIEEPGRNVKAKSGLNRSLLDVAPGTIRRLLEYKIAWQGGIVVAVDPKNTSRRCPVCGHVAKENRESQAVFLCTACGHMDNADVNAAINIRNAAFPHLVATGGLPGLACRPVARSLSEGRSNLSGGRKQEIHEAILGSPVL